MTKRWFWGIFLAGLLLKIGISPWLSSHFSAELFIPFLDSSILHPGTNPWTLTEPRNFPYGSVLYLVLVGPKILAYSLIGDSALGAGPLGLSLFKLPLLLIDILLFLVLIKQFEANRARLLAFYWLNPILIYITYWMGHIDLVPMAFITFSCLLLFRKQVAWSGAFAALALASKFHAIVAMPLLLLFIWRNEFWPRVIQKVSLWIGVSASVTLLSLWLPYQAGHLGYITTTSPEAMRLFSLAIPVGEDTLLYLGFAFLLVVMGRLLVTKKMTPEGLFYGVGILFASLLLVTNPFPSWYVWLLPFCAVFAAEFRLVHPALHMAHVILFFLHFLILPQLPTANAFLNGISLTLLQGTVAAYVALIWYFVGRREFPLSNRLRPFVIGIAGDSGAGKNRLADTLSRVFDVRRNSYVEGDDYHRWERGNQNWASITHLSPRANFLDTMSSHTLTLTSGRTVLQPHYDHGSGRFTPPRPYKPSQTILVQGLHTLYPKSLRDIMDLKVFISPHPLVRLAWKIARDRDERGHSLEKILNSMRMRAMDGQKYIEPQRAHADWIIEALPSEETSDEAIISGKYPSIKMRHLLWNDLPVNALVDSLSTIDSLDVQLGLLDHDIDRVSLVVSGKIESAEVERIANKMFPYLRSLTSSLMQPRWDKDFDGINQLIALSLLNWKEIKETYR